MNTFPLSNRSLGLIGLVGAPFMLISMLLLSIYPALKQTAFDGLGGLVFMLPWMGSLIGLARLGATGTSRLGRLVIPINLGTLTLANLWNSYNAIEPWANTPLFHFLDAFWPISMLAMLLVGITVARAGVLRGWRRYVPLAVGLWMPFTALIGELTGWLLPLIAPESAGDGMLYAMTLSGVYATISWGLLAYLILTRPPAETAGPPRLALR